MRWILAFVLLVHTATCRPAFTLNEDGSYAFSYDTDTGGFHSQSGTGSGASAKYGFSGPGGSLNVQLSGNGGNGGGGPPDQSIYSAGNGAPKGTGTYNLNLNPDGTYSYTYELNDQGKSESRASDGEVMGKFHFTDPDGQKKSIDYTAGIAGFLPTGDHIPKPEPEAAGSPYSAGPSSGGGDAGMMTLMLNPAGDYSYSYNLKDQSKSESGADGKVKGQFSFTGPDGQSRSIQYTADERGFQPTGDHLPKPVEPEAAPSNGGGGSNGGGLNGAGGYSYNYDTDSQAKSESGGMGSVQGQYSVNGPGNKQSVTYTANGGYLPTVEAMTDFGGGNANGGNGLGGIGGPSGPGSYSYNYVAPEHGQSESGDGGSVKGEYSVMGKDSDSKSSYSADKDGFKPMHKIKINFGRR